MFAYTLWGALRQARLLSCWACYSLCVPKSSQEGRPGIWTSQTLAFSCFAASLSAQSPVNIWQHQYCSRLYVGFVSSGSLSSLSMVFFVVFLLSYPVGKPRRDVLGDRTREWNGLELRPHPASMEVLSSLTALSNHTHGCTACTRWARPRRSKVGFSLCIRVALRSGCRSVPGSSSSVSATYGLGARTAPSGTIASCTTVRLRADMGICCPPASLFLPQPFGPVTVFGFGIIAFSYGAQRRTSTQTSSLSWTQL